MCKPCNGSNHCQRQNGSCLKRIALEHSDAPSFESRVNLRGAGEPLANGDVARREFAELTPEDPERWDGMS